MIEMRTFQTRDQWLVGRGYTIGGSDAGAICGCCKYRDNLSLWRIFMGYDDPEDISDRPYVKYGVDCEPLIRQMFALHHPDWNVKYRENNLFLNSKIPYAHASLDGWFETPDGRSGILEIKTTEITSKAKAAEWADNHIPDNYYCQILHYFMVTERDFAVLVAELKVHRADGSNEWRIIERYIERSEVMQDIKELERKERKFWGCVIHKIEPAKILPSI